MENILQEYQQKLDSLRADYSRCEVDILNVKSNLDKLEKFSLLWEQTFMKMNDLYSYRAKVTSVIAGLVKDIGNLPISVF